MRIPRSARWVVPAAVIALAAPALGGPAASAATPAPVITLGIHDGAINKCDRNEHQTTPPTAAELTAATSSLTSKYWPALRVRTVRFSPPWDIAYHHDGAAGSAANLELVTAQACFNAWLAGVRKAGARPEIAFKPDPNYRSPDGTSVGAPDIHTYRLAIDAFTRQYSNPASTGALARVQIIAPWGEPDVPATILMPKGGHKLSDPNCHGSPSVNTCGPILAARMWQAVRASCTRCNVVIAGDFSSLGGIRGPEAGRRAANRLRGSYLDIYRQNLGGNRPTVWGLHPYSDIMAFEKADAAGRSAPGPVAHAHRPVRKRPAHCRLPPAHPDLAGRDQRIPVPQYEWRIPAVMDPCRAGRSRPVSAHRTAQGRKRGETADGDPCLLPELPGL